MPVVASLYVLKEVGYVFLAIGFALGTLSASIALLELVVRRRAARRIARARRSRLRRERDRWS